jgi:hypothetical protein
MAYSDAPMLIPRPGLVALPGGREASAAIGVSDRPPFVLFDCDDLGVEAILELESFLRHPSRGRRDGA